MTLAVTTIFDIVHHLRLNNHNISEAGSANFKAEHGRGEPLWWVQQNLSPFLKDLPAEHLSLGCGMLLFHGAQFGNH